MNGTTHITAKNSSTHIPPVKQRQCPAIFQQNAMIQIIASFCTFREFTLLLPFINNTTRFSLGDRNPTKEKRLEQHRITSIMQRAFKQKPDFAGRFSIVLPQGAQFTLSIPFASQLRTGVIEVCNHLKAIHLVSSCDFPLSPDWTFLGENGSYALARSDSGVIRLISYLEERSWALNHPAKTEAEHKEMGGKIAPYFTNLLKCFLSNNTLSTVNNEGLVGRFQIDPKNFTITLLKSHQLDFLPANVFKLRNAQEENFLYIETNFGSFRKVATIQSDIQFELNTLKQSQLYDGYVADGCSNTNNIFSVVKIRNTSDFNLYAFSCSSKGLKVDWQVKLPILGCNGFGDIRLQANDQFIAVAHALSKDKLQLNVYPLRQGQIANTKFFQKDFAGKLPKAIDLSAGVLSFNTATHLESFYLNAPGGPVRVGRIPKSPDATACLRVESPRDIRVMNSTEQDKQNNPIYRLAYYRLPETQKPKSEEGKK